MAKKHSNILLINPWTDVNGEALEKKIEYELAIEGIRARCFSLSLIHKLCKKNSIDWNLKQTISKSLASSCDAVYVTDAVSDGCADEVLNHIGSEGIPVFTDTAIDDYVKALGVTTVQNTTLIEYCRQIVEGVGEEVPNGSGR